ncbi:MAG: polynucleotide adenylyltransferase [Defluviitaleaceae bacterium]|nr:polynucleotide adenylyltransferase [Defluviitaleaceae bacterium]
MIVLPDNVQKIIQTLAAAGYEAFIVGGCVRDVLRGVTPADWDIATDAKPLQVKGLFSRTVDTGIKHGTVTVLINKQPYEVTTYRIDGEYADGRRPVQVSFSASLEEDLSRRDFTMNAIAYNSEAGFVDPFGGRKDITAGLIRCVGQAAHRFEEDALRMLRAVRFAAVTGYRVDEEILRAISGLGHTIAKVSPERIREEMCKLVLATHPQAVWLLESTGLLPHIFGEEYALPALAAEWLRQCPKEEPMRLALLLIGTENMLQNLRYDNKTINETTLYVRLLGRPLPASRYEIKKNLRYVPPEIFGKFLVLKEIAAPGEAQAIEKTSQELADIVANGECYSLKTLAITGKDLASMGIPPGEKMGEMLESLLDRVMESPGLNMRDILCGMVSRDLL